MTKEERKAKRKLRRAEILKKIGTISLVLLKIAKPLIKVFAKKILIPMLQEKINAGAIDEKVDSVIKDVITEFVDAL